MTLGGPKRHPLTLLLFNEGLLEEACSSSNYLLLEGEHISCSTSNKRWLVGVSGVWIGGLSSNSVYKKSSWRKVAQRSLSSNQFTSAICQFKNTLSVNHVWTCCSHHAYECCFCTIHENNTDIVWVPLEWWNQAWSVPTQLGGALKLKTCWRRLSLKKRTQPEGLEL